jgi:hypothetical protein
VLDRPPDHRGRDSPLAERGQREQILDHSDAALAPNGCTVSGVDSGAACEEELAGGRLLAIGGDGTARDLLRQRTVVAAGTLLVVAADELVQRTPVVFGHHGTDVDAGRRGSELAIENELDRRRELLVVLECQPRDELGRSRGIDDEEPMPAMPECFVRPLECLVDFSSRRSPDHAHVIRIPKVGIVAIGHDSVQAMIARLVTQGAMPGVRRADAFDEAHDRLLCFLSPRLHHNLNDSPVKTRTSSAWSVRPMSMAASSCTFSSSRNAPPVSKNPR